MSNIDASAQSAPGSRGFMSKPSTSVGWLAVWMFLAVLALALLNAFAIMPFTEARAGFDTVQLVFNAIVGLSVLVTAVMGIVAVIAKHERSWAVLLSTLLLIVILGFEMAEIISSL